MTKLRNDYDTGGAAPECWCMAMLRPLGWLLAAVLLVAPEHLQDRLRVRQRLGWLLAAAVLAAALGAAASSPPSGSERGFDD